MAYFAKLEGDLVTEVQRVDNENCLNDSNVEQESIGIAYLQGIFGQNTQWVQSSFNNNIRKRHASIGDTYSSSLDMFITPQPYASWTLDTEGDWQAPIPKPEVTDSIFWEWSEESQSWSRIDMAPQ